MSWSSSFIHVDVDDMLWYARYTMIYDKLYITLCVFSACFFSAWIIIIIILPEFLHESWRLIHSYSFLSVQMQNDHRKNLPPFGSSNISHHLWDVPLKVWMTSKSGLRCVWKTPSCEMFPVFLPVLKVFLVKFLSQSNPKHGSWRGVN